jgi:hypothetical protein
MKKIPKATPKILNIMGKKFLISADYFVRQTTLSSMEFKSH